MSNLNNDLYLRHLTTDPTCSCGFPQETAEHYLLYCPVYANVRAASVATLPPTALSAQILWFGDKSLSITENQEIFNVVHIFIRNSNRL